MLLAANYHYIRESFDAPFPSIFGVTPKEFSEQLDLLGKSAQFLSIGDIVEIIDNKKTLPERSVVITFDDGYKEQYELAWPILNRKGIPAIFFVNTKPIEDDYVTTTNKIHILRAYVLHEDLLSTLKQVLKKEGITLDFPGPDKVKGVYRYDKFEVGQLKYFLNFVLNEEQKVLVIDKCFEMLNFNQARISKDLYMTKEMTSVLANNGSLGTHGHAHLPLGFLSDVNALNDFDMSILKLKEWTGCDMKALSYPFGFKQACSKVVADYAVKKHIKFAFTMERACNKVLNNPMFLARFSINDIVKENYLYGIDGFWNKLNYPVWFR